MGKQRYVKPGLHLQPEKSVVDAAQRADGHRSEYRVQETSVPAASRKLI